jgi:hypothetical protein
MSVRCVYFTSWQWQQHPQCSQAVVLKELGADTTVIDSAVGSQAC